MTISATTLRFDDSAMWLKLSDGRTLGVPPAWFPRVLHATPAQRDRFEIGGGDEGLHWDELDEDIPVPTLVAGRGDITRRKAYPIFNTISAICRNDLSKNGGFAPF
jgi:hypothetical protein